ncbi:MAG: thioesterase family protein [Gammaproteobacteria bacterium]|nr:thioesterase family protein [Gammaproteobacteria bacterium]MBU0788350.1 thioesterase family protein [Gammaproteobacteria bacterium]MBU0815153.1 thioesterase family protein [Gammaproteobacteria bacterium]MBU1785739.1 thioesterase family protein [Gammaproteobacteria bacterium]
MTEDTAIHPFDSAIALTSLETPHHYRGSSSPAYWNMVGPFGGTSAATALQAVMQHPERLGEPIALTVNYASALGEGPFTVEARPVRTNRSTQHWIVTISQPESDGPVVTTATVVTAVRRETWSSHDTPMPAVKPPADTIRLGHKFEVEWVNRYEMRPLAGLIPEAWDGGGEGSESRLWVRDNPPRPLDFPSLAALADVFFPRVWLRRATRVPAGTVSMTVHFHADSQQLTGCGSGYLLGQARAQNFCNGFFDQTAQLWSESGNLLATSSQIVYYKE